LADKTFRSWMQEIREDEDIHAVVLRVNSPGGSGLAADMMWREIQLTRAAGKPVVVSMGDYAASGGYYIAAPADWVVAQPGTLTGSIGVFGGKLALAGMWEKLGMTEFTYRRGAQSDLFSASAPFSEGGRVAFRSFLQDFYDRFLDVVATGRGMERDAAHAVAQGRVWTGRQAMERGLVDDLGGIELAFAKAAELVELDAYGVTTFPASKTLWDQIADDLEAEAIQPKVAIPGVPWDALADLARLERVLSDSGVAALLPGHWEIR
jgi:protease-4